MSGDGDSDTSICHSGTPLVAGGDGSEGLLLPIGSNFESVWGSAFQSILYLAGLMYMFVGVMMIADIFMAAIEKITSKKIRKKNERTGRVMTVEVWNPTVANLTLMALGSSAPEILLSVIELISNSMHSGQLGPSTIVGSAAFNLLAIIAVCVSCIPNGESRKIEEMGVFIVTAVFSIFAYCWLLVILLLISPHVVEVWEGVLTFAYFPLLCVIAYLADIGWFQKVIRMPLNRSKRIYLTPDSTPDEIDQMLLEVRKKYGSQSEGNEQELLHWEFDPPVTRAHRRVSATRNMTSGKEAVSRRDENRRLHADKVSEIAEKSSAMDVPATTVEFGCDSYRCYESDKEQHLVLVRSGDVNVISEVRVKTVDGAAEAGSDYVALDELVRFEPGETEKIVSVKIIDDDTAENVEDFFVVLELPQWMLGTHRLGASRASVAIIDDDHPGTLRFEEDTVTVQEDYNETRVPIKVTRNGGTRGEVSCQYYTEEDSAMAGTDFVEAKGTLVLPHGVSRGSISIIIKPKGRHETLEQFRLYLVQPSGGVLFDPLSDGGDDKCICTVMIEGNHAHRSIIGQMKDKLVNEDDMAIGKQKWAHQFHEALYVGGSMDSEQAMSVFAWMFHILFIPWKLLCACVPPPSYCGGWLCFSAALVVIGLQTAVIGDLASMLGCSLEINDSTTAITIVAIGTSLPDTFASRTAAVQDATADASIVNVTGSNSVNVFLGLGLPWMIGSIYWALKGVNIDDTNDPWVKRGLDVGWLTKDEVAEYVKQYPGTFVVPSGNLGVSVAVFSSCATVAIGIILLRRWLLGCELGGPTLAKYATSAVFVGLWFVYIIVSVSVGD
jgi:solute carrier family 8 (sodium/calcium exchanger)